MSVDNFALGSEFEKLIIQAGVKGSCRLGVNIMDKRVGGICTPWPWRRDVTISQGALDAGADVARAVLAHEVAHTRQQFRWIIPMGVVATLAGGWLLGSAEMAILPASIWCYAIYQLYEVDADKWAAEKIGAENMARVLDMLGRTERWRAWIVRRRGSGQRSSGN